MHSERFSFGSPGLLPHTSARRCSFAFADNSPTPNGSGNYFYAAANNTFNISAAGGAHFYGDTLATAANAMIFQRGKLAIGKNTTPPPHYR